ERFWGPWPSPWRGRASRTHGGPFPAAWWAFLGPVEAAHPLLLHPAKVGHEVFEADAAFGADPENREGPLFDELFDHPDRDGEVLRDAGEGQQPRLGHSWDMRVRNDGLGDTR